MSRLGGMGPYQIYKIGEDGMGQVSLRGVRKAFGEITVIPDLDLEIPDGAFCVFVGPSGCGKSTLLRMIAGLEQMTDGHLAIGGRDMTGIAPAERGVAMVFQSYALYPHMTVADNIGFGLRMTGHPKEEIVARVSKAAALLELNKLLERRPAALSGGQRQRVAIGRAIVRDPKVFLFDEPLSNLDAALRVQMRNEITGLHRTIGTTMIYVTHDQVEAMTMADMIVVLNGGRIEQAGSPLDLYHRPANRFVAAFLGSPSMNFLKGTARAADGSVTITLACGPAFTSAIEAPRITEEVSVGIRPEQARLGDGDGLVFDAVLDHAEYLGAETLLALKLADGSGFTLRAAGTVSTQPGEPVRFHVPSGACHVFNAAGVALFHGDQNR